MDAPTPAEPSGRLIGKRQTEVSPLEQETQAVSDSLAWIRDSRTPKAPQAMVIPDRLGQYDVRGKIAQGGMGVVLRGFHRDLSREVAIKLLRPEIAAEDEQATTRFMREARATAKLRHPGIVAIHDVGEADDGSPYLVMDLVKGEDLKAVIDRGPIAPRRSAELLAQVADAVGHAHSHGILHRDLKPHNVLIDERTQKPHLTDFGLAKSFGRNRLVGNTSRIRRGEIDPDRDVQLTQDGEVMGTPLYMAPEQIDPEGRPSGVKTDVYALGAVLYECLTGSPPFVGDTVFDIFEAVLHDRVMPPRQLNHDVPAELEAICLRCLEKNPLSRYRTAEEFSADLRRFLSGTPVLGAVLTSERPPQAGGSWGRPLVAAVLALGVAGFVGFAPAELRERVVRAGRVFVGEEPAPSEPVATTGEDVSFDPTFEPRFELPDKASTPTQRMLEEEALAGDAKAMYGLGLALLRAEDSDGRGVSWLEKAHAAGYPEAARGLGVVYLQGIGVEADRARSLDWFRKGAEAGDDECRVPLVNALLQEGSYREAATWLEGMAEGGDAQAQLTLGDLHASGAEWADRELSVRWWTAAAEAGAPQSAVAMLRLAQHHERRDEAKACVSWLERAAELNDAEALFTLGEAHELGQLDLPVDLDRAREHYERAREEGHPQAARRLEAMDRGRG